jgi:hypothetical protein
MTSVEKPHKINRLSTLPKLVVFGEKGNEPKCAAHLGSFLFCSWQPGTEGSNPAFISWLLSFCLKILTTLFIGGFS